MPHLSLEYTAELEDCLDFRGIFLELHRVLVEELQVDSGNCKSRAIRRDRTLVGDGTVHSGFVHLGVLFFRGRTEEQKDRLGRRLLGVLLGRLGGSCVEGVQVTVELRDISRRDYFKGKPGAGADAS